jgi:hypothetical protein
MQIPSINKSQQMTHATACYGLIVYVLSVPIQASLFDASFLFFCKWDAFQKDVGVKGKGNQKSIPLQATPTMIFRSTQKHDLVKYSQICEHP